MTDETTKRIVKSNKIQQQFKHKSNIPLSRDTGRIRKEIRQRSSIKTPKAVAACQARTSNDVKHEVRTAHSSLRTDNEMT